MFAVGDTYSLSETLVKTTPILLCALATLLPARLGLVSVGAEGQLFIGAIFGTAVMLAWRDAPLAACWCRRCSLGGMAGGALWGLVPGFLRGRLDVNETITTLLLNYVAALLVNALVYGPWKDPGNLGWPATIAFPAASLGALFGTRVHAGLVVRDRDRRSCSASSSRGAAGGWSSRCCAATPRSAAWSACRFSRQAMIVMALGGAFAGLAGICETAAIQGRLQPGISVGYGLTGFLVAWLSGHSPVIAIPVSFLVGGLIAAGDSLQLFAKVPAASATILQGLLFATALAVGGVAARLRRAHG